MKMCFPTIAVTKGVLAVLSVTCLLVGCGKGSKSDASTPATPATNGTSAPAQVQPSSPVPRAPTQAAPSSAPQTDPNLGQLTRGVRKWIVRNQRAPKSFEEFAASSGMQISAPPAGKKYSLDKRMNVILVDH